MPPNAERSLMSPAADHTKIKQWKETKQGEEGSGEKMKDSGITGREDISGSGRNQSPGRSAGYLPFPVKDP